MESFMKLVIHEYRYRHTGRHTGTYSKDLLPGTDGTCLGTGIQYTTVYYSIQVYVLLLHTHDVCDT